MGMTRQIRVSAGVIGIVSSCIVLSGCIGGPTYGTDKTSGEQLMDDIGSSVSFQPEQPKNLKYQPRPNLVVPPSSQTAQLVQPQQNLATKDNPQWVESPEQTRLRLRQEAEDNADRPGYVSPLQKANANGRALTAKEQQEAYREARRIQSGAAYSETRRSLTDPPVAYRKAPEEAIADLGEPEQVKERRRKKEAAIAGSGKKWWDIF